MVCVLPVGLGRLMSASASVQFKMTRSGEDDVFPATYGGSGGTSSILRLGLVVVAEMEVLGDAPKTAEGSKGLPGAKTEATHRVRHSVSEPNPTRPVQFTPICTQETHTHVQDYFILLIIYRRLSHG